MLSAVGVSVRYPGSSRPAVESVDLTVAPGDLVCLVGPNGSGKTTLARALVGLVPLLAGRVALESRPISGWSPSERARRIGVLAQREDFPFAWRVEEVVGFGRYAWLPPLAGLGPKDEEVIARSMDRADVAGLKGRRIDTLSGGEWQRVRIARALAQEPKVLVLDEPTAALDFGHEMEIFELVRGLTRDGLAALVVTHQLNLAARVADRLVLLEHGRIAAAGTPGAILDPSLLERVFGWPVDVSRLDDGAPQFIPRRQASGDPGTTLPPRPTT